MMAIENIEDRKSFEAWLEETNQPREACVALAARAALRVLPLVWANAEISGKYSALPFLRANLIASVAGLAPAGVLTEPGHASALRAAAAAAADAVRAAAHAAAAYAAHAADAAAAAYADAVRAAAYAAHAADAAAAAAAYAAHAHAAAADAVRAAAYAAAWTALRSDCAQLAGGEDLGRLPLFAEPLPDWFDRAWAQLSSQDADVWFFWPDWYRRLLEGRQQNWPLFLEIATQDDAFWQGSDDEVNARIAEIVWRHRSDPDLSDESLADAAEAYPLGETITRDEQSHYIAIPDLPSLSEEAFDLAKRRARDTVDDMREDIQRSNQLRGLEKVARRVERELERSADAPVLVYEGLTRAIVDLQMLRQNDDFIRGDSLAEETVQQYHDRFLESAVELRAHDPSVRANHDAKAGLKDNPFPRLLDEADKLRAIGQFVHDNAAGLLAEQMPEDAELAADPQEPEENRKSALFRFAGRVVRIFIADRKSVHDMAAAATLIEFVRAHGLIDTTAALIRMLLSLK